MVRMRQGAWRGVGLNRSSIEDATLKPRVCIPWCEWLVLMCRLGEGEMEVGLGVHGEPGAFTQIMQPASAVAAQVRLLLSHPLDATCLEHFDKQVAK